MLNTDERTLARLITDLEELDQLRSQCELKQYQASDPDHRAKFALLEAIEKILQPLSKPLIGLASQESGLSTFGSLDEPSIVEPAAFHPGWSIVPLTHPRGCDRFNSLVYLLDGGFALAREQRLENDQVGFELVFYLSDEEGQSFYCRNRFDDTPEVRLTFKELQAIHRSLPFGLVRLQQRIEQEKAAALERMAQLTKL